MKTIKALCAILLVLSFLAAIPFAVSASGEYTEIDVSIYRKSLDEDETVRCRFYSDLPGIPYIDYAVFLSVFAKDDSLTVTSVGGGQFELTVGEYEETARLDVEKDIMVINNAEEYLYAPSSSYEGEEFYFQYQAVVEYVDHTELTSMTLDFSKYGIDVREENGSLFFPAATLSDIYASINQQVIYYNGESFYYDSLFMDGGAKKLNEEYLAGFIENERSEAFRNYTYNEICFCVENFYGFPCSMSPFMDRTEEAGLDAALEEYDPFTKQLLLSANPAEHVAGLLRLFNFWLFDGGHTAVDTSDVLMSLSNNFDEDFALDFYNTVQEYYEVDTDYRNVYIEFENNYYPSYNKILDARRSAIGSDGYYEEGDTAIISFNGFVIDTAAWKCYCEGNELPETKDDSLLFIRDCLEKARSHGIKNIILDVSANGGGYVATCIGIVSLINTYYDYTEYNKYNGIRYTVTYLTDRDFDGDIDDDDVNVSYDDFNFAILTSMCSFSCANMLPAAMKEAGYMVIGERSGGGASTVAYASTPEGIGYQYSGGANILTGINGENLDDGVPVDVDLLKYTADGEKDYSDFYNVALLRRYMRIFYGELLPGDVNKDGDLDMKDVLCIYRIMAGDLEIGEDLLEIADADGDGAVTVKDALKIRRIIACIDGLY